jgi:CheY-like chemotaxis protein
LEAKITAMKKFKQILLVDDDVISNKIGEKLIRRLEIADEVHCVLNGKDALAYLNVCKEQPDVIFLDLKMPVMDGYEFLEVYQKRQNNQSKMDIVVLTSSTASQDLQRVQKYGIKFYLSKPLLDQNLLKICEIVQADKQPKFVMLGS